MTHERSNLLSKNDFSARGFMEDAGYHRLQLPNRVFKMSGRSVFPPDRTQALTHIGGAVPIKAAEPRRGPTMALGSADERPRSPTRTDLSTSKS